MPDLEDFLIKLEKDAVTALTEYNFVVDEESLDYVPGQVGVVRDQFKEVDVTLDYHDKTITVRAMTSGDPTRNSLRIGYLPWKDWDQLNEMSGVSQAVLDEKGPGIFLTSQLNGCRFTIQYHASDLTKATVLHVAGNYGQNKQGALAREKVEGKALENAPADVPRRRYSIGQYARKPNPKFPSVKPLWPLDDTSLRIYYDADVATVLGVRGKDGKWRFFAQQYERGGDFKNTKEL